MEKEFNQPGADSELEALKNQIADLRKEAAKYRINAKNFSAEKQTAEDQLKSLQEELAITKKENILVKRQLLLDRAGCIKSDLVANIIPEDCEDIESWIEEYKRENGILFKLETENHGGGFKPSLINNLSPSELMNTFIRQAAGR